MTLSINGKTYEAGELVAYVKRLEKENAELKNKLEHRNCLDCSNHSSKLRMRTLELEKENAELKAQLESERDLPAIAYQQGAEKQKKKDTDQLTKAKELLRQLVNIEYTVNIPKDKIISLRVKAEQFLKETK